MSHPDCQWIGLDDYTAWLNAIAALPTGFEHRPEFSDAAKRVTGNEAGLWTCERGGRVACPLLRRAAPGGGFDIVTPMGFSGFAMTAELSGLVEAWSSDWHDRGAIAAYVQLSPALSPAQWKALLPGLSDSLHPGQECWIWNLEQPVSDLLSAMSSKHRQLLQKWLREDVPVVWDLEELLPRLKELYQQFIDRKQVAAAYRYPPDALELLARAPGAFLVGARGDAGEVEAVTLFLSSGSQATSFLNAAAVPGRRHSRGLYWLAALRLRELGVTSMNLGGGLKNGDELSHFKQRMGTGRAPTLVLKQVLDCSRFYRACAIAGVDPGAEGVFPPWLAAGPESLPSHGSADQHLLL